MAARRRPSATTTKTAPASRTRERRALALALDDAACLARAWDDPGLALALDDAACLARAWDDPGLALALDDAACLARAWDDPGLALALLHATPRRRTRRAFSPSGQALHAVCRALAERLSRELHLAPASGSAIPKHFGLAALVLGELLETRIAPTKGGAA